MDDPRKLPGDALDPPYGEWRVAEVERYIEDRHTDPGLRIADAAERFGVTERTIRRDLLRGGDGDTWGNLLRRHRLDTARTLLAQSKRTIRVIARQSGYDSPTSFAEAFKRETGLTPREWRMGKGGRRRAGGPTGAARKPAQRARAVEDGVAPPTMARPAWADDIAIWEAELGDARTRLHEKGHPHVSLDQLADEARGPRGTGRRRPKLC